MVGKSFDRMYPKWNRQCLWEDYGGRIVVVKTTNVGSTMAPPPGEAIALNMEASDVWKLCDGTTTIDDIVEILFNEYDVDMETLKNEVSNEIENMTKNGFITLQDKAEKSERKIFSGKEVFKKSESVIWNELEDQLYIMDTRNSTIFNLPKQFGKLWSLFDGKHRTLDIIKANDGDRSPQKKGETLLLMRELEYTGFIEQIN